MNRGPTVYKTVALPLSYAGMARAKGIEPLTAVLETAVIPFNYARMLEVQWWRYHIGSCAKRRIPFSAGGGPRLGGELRP